MCSGNYAQISTGCQRIGRLVVEHFYTSPKSRAHVAEKTALNQIDALLEHYLLYYCLWQRHRGSELRAGCRLLAAVVVGILIAGCGNKSEDSGTESNTAPLPTAATLGEQVVLRAPEYLARAPYKDADRSHGERQAQICRACHSFEQGGPNMIGPALYGFFGTQAGTRTGFEYSAELREAGFVWTPEAMNAWLAQPGRFLPGNRMTFAGVLRQGDREDLIAYLLAVTSGADDQQR